MWNKHRQSNLECSFHSLDTQSSLAQKRKSKYQSRNFLLKLTFRVQVLLCFTMQFSLSYKEVFKKLETLQV